MGGGKKSKDFGKKNWCEDCQRSFPDDTAYQVHLLVVEHKSVEKPEPPKLQCPYCKKNFKSKSGLAAHKASQVHKTK